MYWDRGYESWRGLRINGQPAAILFTKDGHEVKRWYSEFPHDEVRRLVQGL